jgi:diaminopimelate decarboxylase
MSQNSLAFPVLNEIPPTPFYLYSEVNLSRTIKSIQSVLPDFVDLHFALKSNHNPAVLSFLRNAGLGIDIVSGGELAYALAQEFKSSEVVFSGVGKKIDELELAIAKNVGLINIESEFELHDVVAVARRLGKKANIGFRLNPDVDAKTHPYIATGLKAHKFGISFEDSRQIIDSMSQYSDAVELKGLSMHIGSQIKDLTAIREAAFKLLEEAKLWTKKFPTLKLLDLGGGLGISYEEPLEMADFKSYAEILRDVGVEWKQVCGPNARLALELGRSLVASSGFLFTRVIGLKSNRGSNFCVVDASMTEIMRPSLYQAFHQIVPHDSSSTDGAKTKTFDVVGPVCESSDVLGRERDLPATLKKDDVLMICSAGAYGYVLSNVYNMRAFPAEYWQDERGHLRLVRRSLEWNEFNEMLCAKGDV